MKDENGNEVTLKEFITRILDERRETDRVRFEAMQTANVLARENLDRELHKLNQLRQEVTNDRSMLVTIEKLDDRLAVIDARIGVNERRISWMTGMGVAVAFISGIIGATLMKFVFK